MPRPLPNAAPMPPQMTLDGVSYVLVPKAEYLRLVRPNVAPYRPGDELTDDAKATADFLRAARVASGMDQKHLAHKLGKSQGLVSAGECGRMNVSSKYLGEVLKACGLPKDWTPPKAK